MPAGIAEKQKHVSTLMRASRGNPPWPAFTFQRRAPSRAVPAAPRRRRWSICDKCHWAGCKEVRWFVSVAGVDFKQKNEIGVWPGFLLRLVCIFVDVLFLVASGFLEDLKLKCMWHQTYVKRLVKYTPLGPRGGNDSNPNPSRNTDTSVLFTSGGIVMEGL